MCACLYMGREHACTCLHVVRVYVFSMCVHVYIWGEHVCSVWVCVFTGEAGVCMCEGAGKLSIWGCRHVYMHVWKTACVFRCMHVYIWEEEAYEYIYNAYLHVCGQGSQCVHLCAYLHKEGKWVCGGVHAHLSWAWRPKVDAGNLGILFCCCFCFLEAWSLKQI